MHFLGKIELVSKIAFFSRPGKKKQPFEIELVSTVWTFPGKKAAWFLCFFSRTPEKKRFSKIFRKGVSRKGTTFSRKKKIRYLYPPPPPHFLVFFVLHFLVVLVVSGVGLGVVVIGVRGYVHTKCNEKFEIPGWVRGYGFPLNSYTFGGFHCQKILCKNLGVHP